MFRRQIGASVVRFCLALFLILLNVRVPFLKLYLKLSVAVLALILLQSPASAQALAAGAPGCSSCTAAGCPHFHCPTALKWCMEGRPRICFQHGCPKPICNPSEAPNWGYYQKYW